MKEKEPKIIILSGKAGSGKNKTANIIKDLYEKNNKKVIIISYAYYLKEYAKNIINWDGNEDNKPRDFLQTIGIDIVQKINPKFLINRVLEDIKVYANFFDIIVISDARFKDEIEDVKLEYKNVNVINIYGKDNTLTKEQREHITETALDNYDNYDYKINNNCDIEELEEKVKKIISEVDKYE